jgi:hypothetical protein
MRTFVSAIAVLGSIAGCAWPPSLPSSPANQNQPVEPVASQAAPLVDQVPQVGLPAVSTPNVAVPRVSVPRVSSGGFLRR